MSLYKPKAVYAARQFCVSFIALCSQKGGFKHRKAVSYLIGLCFDPYESWVMTERILFHAQEAEMGLLRRVHGVTLRDKVSSCGILRVLNVEPLLRIERSQLCWFDHVSRMSHERLARHVLLAKLTGKRPRGRPRSRWSGYISDLA